MRHLLHQYLSGAVSRRSFLASLVGLGFTAGAAGALVEAAERGEIEQAQSALPAIPNGRPMLGSGGELMAEQVKAAGTRFVFTNPGSFEVGFFDALVDRPELILIEGLHEGLVVSMADGYSRVKRQPAFVNVHSIAGTAQMAGQLYNAHRDGTPLVVTAGMADTTVFTDEVPLAPTPGFHQTDINRQFTKISWDTTDPAAIPLHVRRAFKTAATAPGGPVYLCVTTTALEQPNVNGEIWPQETFMIAVRPRPAADQIEALTKMLLASERPVAIFGDEVWKSGAQAEAVELCELLAIPSGGALEDGAFPNFPARHPLNTGDFLGGDVGSYPAAGADLVIQVGARDWGTTEAYTRMAPGSRFVAIGMDTDNIGRTEPLNLAIVADVKASLQDLLAALRAAAPAQRLKQLHDSRYETIAAYARKNYTDRLAEAKGNVGKTPIHPDQLALEMDEVLDPNAIIVSENFTGPNELFKFGYRSDEKLWMYATGTALGWGIGAAIGAKLAAPERQVVCSIGDGAVMYSASGFWTMKRYDVPLLTIVWNNRNYQTVRENFNFYAGRMKQTGKYPGMYLGDPDIDFVMLAQSQGVHGERVTAPTGIRPALMRGIRAVKDGNPYVIEVVIARTGPGADSTWYQKFSAR